MYSITLVRRAAWGVLLLFVIAAPTIWFVTRERLPDPIRIAAGAPDGMYYKFAKLLAKRLAARIGTEVLVLETKGSIDNLTRLQSGAAELAVAQLDVGSRDGISALVPVFDEVVHLVVRKGAGIKTPKDLRGKAVVLGLKDSGMWETAVRFLAHYRITPKDLRETSRYFMDLATDSRLDAAIVTTGLLNPALEELLRRGDFKLLPIENTRAITLRNPHYRGTVIPRGFFSAAPSVPPKEMDTFATPAILMVRSNAGKKFVGEVLNALYQEDMRSLIATFIPRHEAATWSFQRRHSDVKSHLNPYEGLGVLANFIDSLAGIKELLFSIGAGIYLVWGWRRKLRRERVNKEISVAKERLDSFLLQTVEIETAQMSTDDLITLRDYLDRITRIKLTALEELTHEELRGDNLFAIFLAQCGHVSQKIQAKIQRLGATANQ